MKRSLPISDRILLRVICTFILFCASCVPEIPEGIDPADITAVVSVLTPPTRLIAGDSVTLHMEVWHSHLVDSVQLSFGDGVIQSVHPNELDDNSAVDLNHVYEMPGDYPITTIVCQNDGTRKTVDQVVLSITTFIVYLGNGNTDGQVPVDSTLYGVGDVVTVKGNTGNLRRTDFAFSGWNTVEDGSGDFYVGGAELLFSRSSRLFAVWTQNATYHVTYDGNGSTSGTVPTDANAYEQGATVTVKGNTGTLARSGYTFTGWNSAANGSGASYAGAETFMIGSANVILYAKWTQNATYHVTYDGNGSSSGSVPTDANAYEQGATVTVKGNTGTLARPGYTFAGWNSAANGSGASYAGSETLMIGLADVILYAKWTQNATYYITYDGNGSTSGTVPTDTNAYEQGATVTVKGNTGTLARPGYTFTGWNSAANGSGASYAGSETFVVGSADVILYAKWTGIPLTITFDKNDVGATGAMEDQTITCGSSAPLAANTFRKNGWSFAGWASTPIGPAVHTDGASYMMGTDNAVLYARWTFAPPRGMRRINSGGFWMGQSGIAGPVYSVLLSQFYIDTTEVIQADYAALMGGANPSNFTTRADLPVERVTWFDAVLYCNARSKRDNLDTVYSFASITGIPGLGCSGLASLAVDLPKNGYRLPTEAQWEYSCRAGTTTELFWGTAEADLYCWYYTNSARVSHPVATKNPNEWGLYDMSGNVSEWCNDWFLNAYSGTEQQDPVGPATGTTKVARGGSLNSSITAQLRSASRANAEPDYKDYQRGFRCVCPAK